MPRDAAIRELRSILDPDRPDRVVTDPAELLVYESDGFTIARARPAAVVFPLTTDEVVRVVKVLAEHDIQIVPRGSGTGLAGGCVAFNDGIIVCTAQMNRILKIDLENRVAHVQAGVCNTQLTDSAGLLLGGAALHFAPDPSSQRASTIGGNAATNAGGIHTVKDFTSSNHVLGIEMVLADGSVLRTGPQNGCYESGPFDLPAIICGSEGTLGIITSLWVRLVPKPASFRTMVATFGATADGCNAVSAIIASGLLPSAMEMMDGLMVRTVEDAFHFGFSRDAQALLLIEIDGIESLLDEQLRRIEEICRANHALSVESSADPERRAALWKARKSAFGAIGRVSHSYCTQDACVPRSRLAEVLTEISRIGREFGMSIPSAFHAGDGNVHPIFLYDDHDDAQMEHTLQAAEAVLDYCISVGGTITGEHGVGVEKLHMMPHLFDKPTMAQFAGVKRAFDPGERINAGKLVPSDKVVVRLLKPGRNVPQ